MILYNKGDPVEALRTLGPWIRQVHIKDAVKTKDAGDVGRGSRGRGGTRSIGGHFLRRLTQLELLRQFRHRARSRERGGSQTFAPPKSLSKRILHENGTEKNQCRGGRAWIHGHDASASLSGQRFRAGRRRLRAARLPVNGVLQGVRGNIKTNSDDIHLGPGSKCFAGSKTFWPTARSNWSIFARRLRRIRNSASPRSRRASMSCAKNRWRGPRRPRGRFCAWRNRRRVFLCRRCACGSGPAGAGSKRLARRKPTDRILAARFRRVSEMPGWSKQGIYSGGVDLGGALFDLHIHDTDFVNFLFGRPSAVFSSGVINSAGTIDHVVTQYIYPGGPAVHAEGNWLLTQGFNMSYHDSLRARDAGFRSWPRGRRDASHRAGPGRAHHSL